MNLSSCPSSFGEHEADPDWGRASEEAFDHLRVSLRRWLPFARIVRGHPQDADFADVKPVLIFVRVSAAELEVTGEILSGFFLRACASLVGAVSATFVDEGITPLVLLYVILSGSVLDESFRFGNARRNYGGLLKNERFATDGIRYQRASTEGQQAGTDASLRQAVASS